MTKSNMTEQEIIKKHLENIIELEKNTSTTHYRKEKFLEAQKYLEFIDLDKDVFWRIRSNKFETKTTGIKFKGKLEDAFKRAEQRYYKDGLENPPIYSVEVGIILTNGTLYIKVPTEDWVELVKKRQNKEKDRKYYKNPVEINTETEINLENIISEDKKENANADIEYNDTIPYRRVSKKEKIESKEQDYTFKGVLPRPDLVEKNRLKRENKISQSNEIKNIVNVISIPDEIKNSETKLSKYVVIINEYDKKNKFEKGYDGTLEEAAAKSEKEYIKSSNEREIKSSTMSIYENINGILKPLPKKDWKEFTTIYKLFN